VNSEPHGDFNAETGQGERQTSADDQKSGGHDLYEPWRVASIPQDERVLEFGLNQLLSGTSAPDGTTPPMVL